MDVMWLAAECHIEFDIHAKNRYNGFRHFV